MKPQGRIPTMEEMVAHAQKAYVPEHLTGEQILEGVLKTDFVLHNILRAWVQRGEVPQVYLKTLSRIFKRYLVNVEESKNTSKPIDTRLENIMQRGNEVCDVITDMVQHHYLNDFQLEELKGPLADRGRYGSAYSDRRKNGVVIFDGASRRVN